MKDSVILLNNNEYSELTGTFLKQQVHEHNAI